jgi:hypothetical protein
MNLDAKPSGSPAGSRFGNLRVQLSQEDGDLDGRPVHPETQVRTAAARGHLGSRVSGDSKAFGAGEDFGIAIGRPCQTTPLYCTGVELRATSRSP